MSTVQEIEAAVSNLSREQLRAFQEWFEGFVAPTPNSEPSAPLDESVDFDLEHDTPELAAELLKAAEGPFTPYSRNDLESIAAQVLREKSRE